MSYEFTPYAVPFLLTLVCLVALWYLALELTEGRLRAVLLVWTTAFLVWTVAAVMRLSATTVPDERLWHNLRFVGPSVATACYLLFTAEYTDRVGWFRPRFLAGLFAVPAATNLLAWTNPLHDLVRASVAPAPAGAGPLAMSFTPGSWFLVHAAYSYLLVIVGSYWLLDRYLELRGRGLYRRQIGAVLLTAVVMLGTNLLFNAGITTIDWSPVAGGVSTLIFIAAVAEYRFLDVSPVARDIVVENMDGGMVVADTDDEIVDVDDRAATLLAARREDLLGAPLAGTLVARLGPIETLPEAGTSRTVRVERGGEARHYEVTVSPIHDDLGVHLGRVVTFLDVTEPVEQRARLREQKRRLERQNERLDEFASVVSHDLRNPLAVAGGYLDAARETGDVEHLGKVDEAHDRMETMIEDLLAMARAGAATADPEPVALGRVAADAWTTAGTDGARLRTAVPDDRTVRADPDLLRRLLENLFRNAVDHNEPPVTVTVGTVEGGFYVADDGAGIPADEREQVFERGYTTADDGAGFGLSIVRELADAHGWELDVTASDAGGARFEVGVGSEPGVDPRAGSGSGAGGRS